MFRLLSLGVVAYATWLLWSGYFEPLLLSLGAVSCVLVLLVARPMGILDEEGVPVHLNHRLLLYIPWLVWAIVKANVDVARIILNPRLPISPRIVRVRPGQRTDLGRVIYANSITLTPGTVTCDADGDEFAVHALTQAAADDLAGGDMDRRVTAVEGQA